MIYLERNISIEQIINVLKQYEGLIDLSNFTPLIDRYLKTKDGEMREFLLSRISERLEKAMSDVLAGRATQAEGEEPSEEGEFVIGEAVDSRGRIQPLRLSRDNLNKNILIIASVGHGKTSLIKRILDSLYLTDITYVIFDVKRDYVSFGTRENSFYLDSSNLKINILDPPKGIALTDWAMHVADVFSHSFSLLIGSRDFLLEAIINLYKSWKNSYPPSLADLANYIESGRRSEYAKVVLGRIKAVLASTRIFDCNKGIDLSKLDKFNLIFGMDNLGIAEQSFIASFIILYLYHLRMGDTEKRGKLQKVIVIDDAHTILDINKERDQALGVPILHTLISKMRELGVGFIFSDQQLSSLLSSAIQNSNIDFIGSVNLMKDLSTIFDSSMIREVSKAVSKLKVGEFLVISSSYSPYGVMKAYQPKEIEAADLKAVNEKVSQRKDLFQFEKFDKKADTARLFAEELVNNPFGNLSAHKRNLNMKAEDFDALKSKLLGEGLIHEVAVKLDKQREAKYLYLNQDKPYDLKALGLTEDTIKRIVSMEQFVNRLLKRLSILKLKEEAINFESDEIGILLPGLKIYIVFMHKPGELLRLMETPFRRVIDVLDDRVKEDDAMIELIKSGRGANLSTLRFCHIYNFIDTLLG